MNTTRRDGGTTAARRGGRCWVVLVLLATAGLVVGPVGGGGEVEAEAFTALSAGEAHTCIILNGEVQCWGQNDAGQLGDGTFVDSPTPVTATGLTNAVAVSSGKRHTCAITADETLWCWGANNGGALGLGAYGSHVNVPTQVPSLTGVKHVSTGVNSTCATKNNGTLLCTGNVTTDDTGSASAGFVAVDGVTDARMSAASEFHQCVVLEDDTAECWGSNSFGKLGIGVIGGTYDAPQPVLNLTNIDTIHSTSSTTCALLLDDTVSCWGANFYGQLGNGTTDGETAPVPVPGLTDVERLATAAGSACAIRADDTLWCWGHNVYYSMQQASTVAFLTSPTQLAVPFTPGNITGGQLHYCAVATDGYTTVCWGSNRNGQLSAPITGTITTPVTVPSVTGSQIGAAIGHVCAVTLTDTVECWGSNGQNETGTSIEAGPPTPPAEVPGITAAVAVEGGSGTGANPRSTCALLSDDSLTCWPPALEDPGPSLGATSHALGSAFGCAVLADDTIECWGEGSLGQLGDGNSTDAWTTPVPVTGITTADIVDAGFAHACAVLTDDTARCWGHGFQGKLGDGNTTNSPTPVTVSGLTGAVDISAGEQHSCAVKSDGTVWCWGYDYPGGTLGDGNYTSSPTPVQVSGITTAIAVEAGTSASCALLSGGGVECWGTNDLGQLGNGTTTPAGTPVAVTGVSIADQLSLTYATACVHNTDDTFSCWGSNGYGQAGAEAYSATPIVVPLTTPLLCDGIAATVVIANGDVASQFDDVIVGTNGPDVIDGLGGDDLICGYGGADTINGGDGLDTIFGNAGADDIDGGQGNDTIYGGNQGDTIFGSGGSDKLWGEGGDDIVRGGTGNDKIYGGPGADELRGQNGEDDIWANTDTANTTTDIDEMHGGGLYDGITGDDGDDVMYGGDFADILAGRGGDDEIYGNNGADTLRGGAHVVGDYCNGGTINSNSGDTAVACETVLNVP